jgi:D-tyrosyl-tRNA(Tyr) deacylase
MSFNKKETRWHVTEGGFEELSKVAHVWSQSRLLREMKIYRSDDKDRVCESVHEQKSLLLLKELRNLQNRHRMRAAKKYFGVPPPKNINFW